MILSGICTSIFINLLGSVPKPYLSSGFRHFSPPRFTSVSRVFSFLCRPSYRECRTGFLHSRQPPPVAILVSDRAMIHRSTPC